MTGRGIVYAIAAAVLFGASTPIAKVLLIGIDPAMLAALLYLGAGVGLGLAAVGRRLIGLRSNEHPLQRRDGPRLALVVLFGGVLGPLFLMFGLARTDAASASLLLNLETLATLGIAWLVYRENVDRRLLIGAGAILAGALVLSWQGFGRLDPGSLLIAGACLCWGIDNNLTRALSGSDPQQIAMVKGLGAGTVTLGIALGTGSVLPPWPAGLSAGAVGFLGYGASLTLFVLALRHLGTARAGAYFATAPFVGAGLAVAVMGAAADWTVGGAAVLMVIGLWLHLTERHDHDHDHAVLTHAHRHSHDTHHQHDHPPGTDTTGAHSHAHHHPLLRHRHPHYPDLHHRHDHGHH